MKEFYNRFENPKTYKPFLLSSFTQYYWITLSRIVQDSSLLAKSLGLISVPVWLILLSAQLRIISLVSIYLTNNLILYKLILKQLYAFFEFITAKHY